MSTTFLSFFKAVLDGISYTHREQERNHFRKAAMNKLLMLYGTNRNIHRIASGLQDITSHQDISNTVGHTIIVYNKPDMTFHPTTGPPLGSPIVVTQDEKGRYTLDIKRTQYWSLYGAVAAAVSTTPEGLYGDVKKATMAAIRENPDPYRPWFITHLETSPRINYTKNVINTYLRQYKNTFLETVNQAEIQAMANVIKRAITVDTPTGVVRAVPTESGNATEPPLEIKIRGGRHYTIVNTPRSYPVPSDQQHKIDSLIAMFDRVTTTNTKTDDTPEPDMKDLLKRHARLLDIYFDDLTPEEAKKKAETLLDDIPGYRDTIQREYEKYIRSQMETTRIPNAYRLDTSGRQTPPSTVSYNVDFTGLSPNDARFKRDFEMTHFPKHADSIQRQFDAYMAQRQDAEPNRENTASAISERLEEIRNAAEHVQTPQEARRLDTEIHNARNDVVQYIETHHPDAIPQVLEETAAAPPKVARHTGDALGVGALIVGGLSLISSYASVWRVFFSG